MSAPAPPQPHPEVTIALHADDFDLVIRRPVVFRPGVEVVLTLRRRETKWDHEQLPQAGKVLPSAEVNTAS